MAKRPLLVTEEQADAIRHKLGERFSGGGRIEVRQAPDGVSIVDRSRVNRGGEQVSEAAGIVPVQVKLDGGAAGSRTQQCSFTYSIWPIGADINDVGLRLATERVPHMRAVGLPLVGKRVAAADGSYGAAFQDPNADGEWALLIAYNERDEPGPC